MKIRNGFVSNSSSSSFIIALEHKPSDQSELKQMIFGNEQVCHGYPTTTLSESLWNKIKNQIPMTDEEAIDTIASGWFKGHPDIAPNWKVFDFEEYERDIRYKAQELFKKWKNKVPKNHIMLCVHYDDHHTDIITDHEIETILSLLPIRHISVSHH